MNESILTYHPEENDVAVDAEASVQLASVVDDSVAAVNGDTILENVLEVSLEPLALVKFRDLYRRSSKLTPEFLPRMRLLATLLFLLPFITPSLRNPPSKL